MKRKISISVCCAIVCVGIIAGLAVTQSNKEHEKIEVAQTEETFVEIGEIECSEESEEEIEESTYETEESDETEEQKPAEREIVDQKEKNEILASFGIMDIQPEDEILTKMLYDDDSELGCVRLIPENAKEICSAYRNITSYVEQNIDDCSQENAYNIILGFHPTKAMLENIDSGFLNVVSDLLNIVQSDDYTFAVTGVSYRKTIYTIDIVVSYENGEYPNNIVIMPYHRDFKLMFDLNNYAEVYDKLIDTYMLNYNITENQYTK